MGPLKIARICHEANRQLQLELGEKPSAHWEECTEEMQASAIEGVQIALRGAGPREMHQAWMEHKIAQGWHWGEKKSELMKTHPCIVDYDELPAEQKLKDDLFLAVVHALKD